jgi:hypothetical protein
MSERMLKEFAAAAEQRVPEPDLAELEARGRDLRRNRRATGGVLAALVLVVGGTLAARATVQRDDARPEPAPAPRVQVEELPSRILGNSVALRPGRSYGTEPWVIAHAPVGATFVGPAGGWTWRGDAATRSVGGPAAWGDTPRGKYAAVGVMVADRVSGHFCDEPAGSWTTLADAPVTAARQIARAPGVTLVEPARADSRFGQSGAHVRITVPRLCPKYNDVLLWGLVGSEDGGGPGLATVFYPGQTLDVWVLDVGGTRVVVWSELSPGLPATYGAQARRMLDSMRLEPKPR